MSIEHEVKASLSDDEMFNCIEILDHIGAKHGGNFTQKDVYFSTGNPDETLRIRYETATLHGEYLTYITYKGKKMNDYNKTRQECESTIGNGIAVADMLKALGYKEMATIFKKRTIYKLGGVTIAKDNVEGLGNFIEIEIIGDDKYCVPINVPHKFNDDLLIAHIADMLGLSNLTTKSYLELMMEKEGD